MHSCFFYIFFLLTVTPFQSYNKFLPPTQSRKEYKKFGGLGWGGWGGSVWLVFFKDASKLLRKREGDLLHSSLIKKIMRREKRLHKTTSLFFLFVDIILKMLTRLISNCYSYSGSFITTMAIAVFISDEIVSCRHRWTQTALRTQATILYKR